MRIAHLPRPSVFISAVALGVSLLASSLILAVPFASAASGPADSTSSEFVRLINGVRAANGLAGLRLDPTLAGLARDTPMSCPSDPSLVMLGRARDGADNNFVSHYLRLCPTVKFVSILQSTFGYGSVGEIMLQSSYGTGEYLMSYQGSASTLETNTYAVTGHGMLGWMGSSVHAPIIVGAYDRVGCGGWTSPAGVYFFDCLFSQGGPNGTANAPTRAPFAEPVAPPPAPPAPVVTPAPVQKATPVPTRNVPPATAVATPTVTVTQPVAANSPEIVPSTSATVSPSAQPSATPFLLVAGIARAGATPFGGAAAAQLDGGSADVTGIVMLLLRGIASLAGSAASVLGGYALVLRRRRRRGELAS